MYRNLHDFNSKTEVRDSIEADEKRDVKWIHFWNIAFIVFVVGANYMDNITVLLCGFVALRFSLIHAIEGINRHWFLRTIDYLNAEE